MAEYGESYASWKARQPEIPEHKPRSRRPVRAIPNYEDRPPHPAQHPDEMDTDDWRSE